MYYSLAPGARLYRITDPDADWPNPLWGLGAYFTKGGRYNRAHHKTIYCAEDPLVAITEAAFYQSLDWQQRLSYHRFNPVTYPLVSRHRLWCFNIDPPPALIDLENPLAIHQFQFPPHALLNPSLNPRHGPVLAGSPSSRDYVGTQDLADDIRAYNPPPGSPNPRPEGVKAPSVRMPWKGGTRSPSLALFVLDPKIQQPYDERATLLDQWDLELEFRQTNPPADVDLHTIDIDWTRPRFRCAGPSANVILAHAARPASVAYQPHQWYDLEIRYA